MLLNPISIVLLLLPATAGYVHSSWAVYVPIAGKPVYSEPFRIQFRDGWRPYSVWTTVEDVRLLYGPDFVTAQGSELSFSLRPRDQAPSFLADPKANEAGMRAEHDASRGKPSGRFARFEAFDLPQNRRLALLAIEPNESVKGDGERAVVVVILFYDLEYVDRPVAFIRGPDVEGQYQDLVQMLKTLEPLSREKPEERPPG